MDKTSNESDGSEKGYYLRTKRRRLNDDGVKIKPKKIPKNENRKRKSPIMHLPTEVLQKIFYFLSFSDLNNKVRMVNRRFKTIAENELNVGFKIIETNIQNLIKKTYETLKKTEKDNEIKHACKKLNMLELVNIQHRIVHATIWRMVYNDYYRTHTVCMFGGRVLDCFVEFLTKFNRKPEQMYTPMLARDFSLPNEIANIVTNVKQFCVYFDKIVEEDKRNPVYTSGCKLLDLLECALFAQKTTMYEKTTNNIFTAKYCYFFNNTWFFALPNAIVKEMSLKQQQRMMHMRIRRIVLSHTDMYLQQAQYQREIEQRMASTERIKRPGNNVYTGYGDVEDKFFYYGVMNNGAYVQKFQIPNHENDEEDEEHEDNEQVIVNVQQNNDNNNQGDVDIGRRLNNPSSDNMFYRIPHLGLRIDVSVTCPLEYAPLKIVENSSMPPSPPGTPKKRPKGPTEIVMVFDCYGGYYPRLPTHYKYKFRPTLRHNM